jgi:hypothetical protein
MVPAKYPCPETILEPLAHHCHATDDVIIYLGISYGWGSLVECLNRYDGPWNDASRIVIERRGIVLTDRYGAATLYPWSHFGIKVPDTY